MQLRDGSIAYARDYFDWDAFIYYQLNIAAV